MYSRLQYCIPLKNRRRLNEATTPIQKTYFKAIRRFEHHIFIGPYFATASHHHHRTMPKHLSVELKGRIIGAYEFGTTPSIIAKKHNILISTVFKVITKWGKDGI